MADNSFISEPRFGNLSCGDDSPNLTSRTPPYRGKAYRSDLIARDLDDLISPGGVSVAAFRWKGNFLQPLAPSFRG